MIWVVIPYREDASGHRQEQLQSFLSYMNDHLSSAKFIVVEQFDDDDKFNCGALYNAAFREIFKYTHEDDVLIFHNVNLLPDQTLLKKYTKPLREFSVRHCGPLYNKGNEQYYFGGVIMIRCKDFLMVNGFPNDIWGWRGAKTEFRKRLKAYKFSISVPKHGSFTDLESMNWEQKIKFKQKHNMCCSTTDFWLSNYMNNLMRKRIIEKKINPRKQLYLFLGVRNTIYNVEERKKILNNVVKITIDFFHKPIIY